MHFTQVWTSLNHRGSESFLIFVRKIILRLGNVRPTIKKSYRFDFFEQRLKNCKKVEKINNKNYTEAANFPSLGIWNFKKPFRLFRVFSKRPKRTGPPVKSKKCRSLEYTVRARIAVPSTQCDRIWWFIGLWAILKQFGTNKFAQISHILWQFW